MKNILLVALLALQVACTSGPKKPEPVAIVTEEITYQADGKKMVGYIAKPKDLTANAPAVLVVHEWWGQTDYPRKRAEMLAEQGYVAMAIDMFGERKIADHPKTAGEFAMAAMKNGKVIGRRFNGALKAIKAHKNVDATKIAAIGYCFGGSVVLEMAKQGADLKAVASFHGGLKTPTAPVAGKIKAKVAVFNGEKDPMVTADQIKEFEAGMKLAKVEYSFVNYPVALHGFTNPQASVSGEKFSLPLAYDPKADLDSWNQLTGMLKEALK